jgi:hypothetical protein
MNKRNSRWWVVVWLGLATSTSVLAANALQESAIKPGQANERPAVMSGSKSVANADMSTNSSQDSNGISKLPGASGYDSGAVPGPSSLPFILAGLGALAVAAARRRTL